MIKLSSFRRVTVLAAIAAALGLGPFVAAPSDASTAAPPAAPAVGGVPLTLTGAATRLPGGDVATTWQAAGGVRVQAAGAAGSRVVLHRTGQNTATATAVPAPTATTPAQYAASGRSVYWDALAVGASPAQAARLTASLGAALPAGVRGAALASAAVVRPLAGIYNSVCTSVGAEPGNWPGGYAVQGYACLTQSYIEQKPGAWYISNEISSEGISYAGSLGNLTQLRAWDCYCNGYTYYLVQSHPNATISVGNPTTQTFSVNVPGVGSVSDSVTVYPSSEGPYYPDGPTNGQGYGATWHGSAWGGTWVDDDSLSLIHDGKGTTNNARINVAIWWRWP